MLTKLSLSCSVGCAARRNADRISALRSSHIRCEFPEPKSRRAACDTKTAVSAVIRSVPQAARLPARLACSFALLFLLSAVPSFAEDEVLMREVVSREMAIFNGQGTTNIGSEVISREISIFNGQAVGHEMPEVISREFSIVNTTDDPPDRINNLSISTSPTGERVTLDWSSYNELANNDVATYAIYYSSNAFSDVSGMTAYTNIPAGQLSLTLDGLPAWRDHFFAIVPVDALGYYHSNITYSASYVLGSELISREMTIFNGQGTTNHGREVISREMTMVVGTDEPPARIGKIPVSTSPTGEEATLNWSSYNELAQNDVATYAIYYSSAAFDDITGMTPYTNVMAGTMSITLENLPAWQDHFFAIVPVDSLGHKVTDVIYNGAYVLGGELISREIAIFNGQGTTEFGREVISREMTMLVGDVAVPAPVTGLNSGFTAITAVDAYQAVSLSWPNYNELAQNDVVAYRIYVADTYFEDVSAMAPFKTIAADRLAYTLGGLDSGGIYHVAVVAEDMLGNFDPAVRSVSCQASVGGVSAVRNLSVEGGETSLVFTWDPPEEGTGFLDHYEVYFGGASEPETLPTSAGSYTATNLERAHSYPFQIVAVDVFDIVNASSTAMGVTWLYNPTNLVLSEQGGEIVLDWDASEPAQFVKRYELYRSTSPITDVTGLVSVSTSLTTRAVLGPLASVENDWFAVATVNTLGGTTPTVNSIQVSKLAQTIDFPAILPGARQIPMNATASSGLPVSYVVSPASIAEVVGSNTLSVIQGGTVRVTAYQDGDAVYWPAEASQTLRLPPVIESFTANGSEIADGMLLERDATLAVDARDADGIDSVEFSYRSVGGSWTSLGTGSSANLPVSALTSGDYELRVSVVAGTNSAVRTHTVTLDLQPILGLSLGHAMMEGMMLDGTVTVQRTRSADLAVTLGSSRPTQLDPGSPVTIPAGQTVAAFQIEARQDVAIEEDMNVRITATAPGAISAEQTVELLDDDWPMVSLSLSRSIVPESAGPNAAVARVEREPVTAEAVTVYLTNSDPTAAFVPESVTIAANEGYIEFPVGAIDDDLLDGSQITELKAEVRLGTAGIIAESEIQPLEVGDDEGPTLELQSGKNWIFEGETNQLTIVRHGDDTTEALEVNFETDQPLDLQIPATAMMLSGSSNIYADVIGLDATNGSRLVMVTASATNYGPAQLPLIVTDEYKPDFVVTGLQAPTQLESDETFDVSYLLENQGSGGSSNSFVQRVFLSQDAVPGGDILLAQETQSAVFDIDGSVAVTENVRAPQAPGDYWLFVIADAGLAVDEIIEWNNAAILAQPITVSTPWAVTVETDAELVPANTPILFHGSAVRPGGETVPFVTVHVHIRVNGTERILSAITDANGDYELHWQPLPGEGGDYEVGACHPGVNKAPTQDGYTILDFEYNFPGSPISLMEGGSVNFTGYVYNASAFGFDCLSLDLLNIPDGIDVTASTTNAQLSGEEYITVALEVLSTGATTGLHNFELTVGSAQGNLITVPFALEVIPLAAELTLQPQKLKTSVLRDTSSILNFEILNNGGISSGAVDVLLPDVSWIKSASPTRIDTIPPGRSEVVSILLQPAATEHLGVHSGHLVVRLPDGMGLNLPYEFRVVSEAIGDLEVEVSDEFTYFAEDHPQVEGAVVVLRDIYTADEVARGVAGSNGVVRFEDILEGWYQLDVDSPDHTRSTDHVQIHAGELNTVSSFISRELVTYNWTVEEIELEDRYKISIESTYEVNVPAPVVTIEPSILDVSDLYSLGQTKVVYLEINNHGFIAAQRGRFEFDSHPYYEITPQIDYIGTIPAKSSIMVPVVLERIRVPLPGGAYQPPWDDDWEDGGNDGNSGSNDPDSSDGSSVHTPTPDDPTPDPPLPPGPDGGDPMPGDLPTDPPYPPPTPPDSIPCGLGGRLHWSIICGNEDVKKTTPVGVTGVVGKNCGSIVSIIGQSGGGGGTPAGTPSYSGGASFSSFGSCIPCEELQCRTSGDLSVFKLTVKLLLDQSFEAFIALVKEISPFKLDKPDYDVGPFVSGEICPCCEDNKLVGWSGNIKGGVKAEAGMGVSLEDLGEVSFLDEETISLPGGYIIQDLSLGFADTEIAGKLGASAKAYLMWDVDCDTEEKICLESELKAEGKLEFPKLQGSVSFANTNVVPHEVWSGRVTGEFKAEIDGTVLGNVCLDDELIPSVQLRACGSYLIDGFYNIITNNAVYSGDRVYEKSSGCYPPELDDVKSMRMSFSTSVPFEETIGLIRFEDLMPNNEEIFPYFQQGGGGVCAHVRMSIDQDAVMTRSVFRATLELKNNQPAQDLNEVNFELDVRDEYGLPVGDRFNVQITDLQGLDAIDGTGMIEALSSGVAQWTLVPRDTAAPLADTVYTVGGTISYLQDGVQLSIPVQPMAITVRPDAALHLKYYHQRDVISDDPHTDPIEAKEPFGLAVVVENRGAGAARNLTITSAQPEIIDNEKGLLIDFEIIGSEVAGEQRSPSLMADFGTIDPGEQKTATWWLTASLHGFFKDYEATFEHLDGFGDPRLSLIKDVQIYEMIRMANALGDQDDSQPDFLTNEEADFGDYPIADTLHLSDGTVSNVEFLGEGANCSNVVAGQLTVELSLTNGARSGWTYLRFPDPADGAFRLAEVVRSDGLVIPVGTNVWTTDRTFIGVGRRPVYENYLHLLDHDSTGSYSLRYEETPDDSEAPVSSVEALAVNSSVFVPVWWGGSDNVALATFDVMVSTNGGPWGVWLKDTTRISSIFEGATGNSYAFYCVATDTSGNVEDKVPAAEASTTVSIVNLSPVLNLPIQTNMAEGAVFEYQVVATDPEGGALDYSVISERAGAVIDSAGLIRWTTSELDGGASNRIQVTVMDDGIPLGMTSAWFTVVVDEVNIPPQLESIAPQTVVGDALLFLQVQASDNDVPMQTITYSLGANSPSGMVLDATDGLLTWAPPTNLVGQSVVVEVIATDDGVPAMSATNRFTVSVVEKILDTTPPLEIPDLAIAADTGMSDTDSIVSVTNFSVTGTLPENNLMVEVYLDGAMPELLATVTPYSLALDVPVTVDQTGDLELLVRCIDESDNATDNRLGIHIDMDAPTVELHLDGPMKDGTNYLDLVTARMVFSESVNVSSLMSSELIEQAIRLDSTNSVMPKVEELTWHSVSNTLVWSIPANTVTAGGWMLHLDGQFFTDVAGNKLVADGESMEQGMPVVGVPVSLVSAYSYAAPAWHDYNGDGLPDLLVGEKTASSQGQIKVFLNEGSATNPVFSAYEYLEVGGAPLAVPCSGCLGISVRLADLTHDGLDDLVVGRSDGTVWLYEATSTASNGWNFSAGTNVWSGASRAMVDVADLDADGTNEVVVGGMDGRFSVLDDGAASYLGDPLVVAAGRSAPSLADLNGDGQLELVSGDSNGGLWSFFGSSNSWNNTAWEIIDTPSGWARSRPCVADVNGDDVPDFLVGTADGLVRVLLGEAPVNPALAVSVVDAGPKFTLTASSGEGGHIEPGGSVVVYGGENQTFSLVPDDYWHVESILANGVPFDGAQSFTFTNVTENGLIHAEFAPNMVTNAPVALPESWLAGFGWTNDFEFAATNDFDGDGFAAWEEYVAGTSPIDKASVFRITQIRKDDGGLLITWTPSTAGRRYRVVRSGTPGGPYTEVVGTLDGPADTLLVPASGSAGMFRMEVELSEAPPQWTVMAFAGANGSITPDGLQYATPGSNTFHFAVAPNEWHHIVDVKTNGISVGAVESLTLSNVTENTGIQAEFALNMVVSAPVAVPERYLAGFGWTNNLNSVVTNDFDGDGLAVWQEYVAGSNPTNGASFFRITQIRNQDGGLLISWTPSVEDRRYRVMRAPSLGQPFSEEVGTVAGPAHSIIVPALQSMGMLRVEVELTDAAPQWVVVATSSGHGSITPSGLLYATPGSNTIHFAITPNDWYHIADVTVNGVSTGAVETLVLENINRNMEVHAIFAENLVTNGPVDIPEHWFARYGVTTGFASALISDTDGDGFANWEEYVADSIPTNSLSFLQITNSVVKNGEWIIEWSPSVFGRTYTPVLMNLSTGTNTPLPEIEGGWRNSVTNDVPASSGALKVECKLNVSE